MEVNEITEGVIGAAIAVHSELGPGLLESAYTVCLAHELEQRSFHVTREVPVPLRYKGRYLECGYRLDLVVEDVVVVEVKAVDRLDPVFTAQLLTYLRLSQRPVGLLINFNVPLLKLGLRRLVLDYSGPSPRPPRPPR